MSRATYAPYSPDEIRWFWINYGKTEAPMPIEDDRLIGDPPNPYGPVGVWGGVPVYAKPDLLPGYVELRDRYGVLIGTIRNVGSISMHGEKKE